MIQNTRAEPEAPMTFEEYLEFEEKSLVKHEFVNGRLREVGTLEAMAGGTLRHNDITVRITAALYPIARKAGCRVNASDALTQSGENGYYPDLMVSCASRGEDKRIEKSPCIIFEILSPSTAITDYNEKRWAYNKIESLEQYILVSSDAVQVEVFTRQNDGWLSRVYTKREESFLLNSLNSSLTLEGIYEDIEF